MTGSRPIDSLIDRSNMRCTKCQSLAGTCSCWATCRCGWSFEAAGKCRNPLHDCESAADQAATFVASNVILDMRGRYPQPMRHASGGFSKTLREVIQREARDMVLEILLTPPRDEMPTRKPEV